MAGLKLSERSIKRLERQLLRAEGGAFDPPPRRSQRHRHRDPTPRVVLLLEDCESGGRAEAAILTEIESTETQILEICGTPFAGTFTLEFDEKITEPIDFDATAEALQDALEDLDNIDKGDVLVEIGPGAAVEEEEPIYRWLIHFTGQFESQTEEVPELIVHNVDVRIQGVEDEDDSIEARFEVRTQPDLEDTGDTIEVLCVVPLPPGITIYAGSIAIALPVPGFGYCLTAVECHDCRTPDFNPYGY